MTWPNSSVRVQPLACKAARYWLPWWPQNCRPRSPLVALTNAWTPQESQQSVAQRVDDMICPSRPLACASPMLAGLRPSHQGP